MSARKTFGVVATLKRGIPVRGAFLCPLCGGDGEIEPCEVSVADPNSLHKDVCWECGSQGWLPDDCED